jgi:nitroreductase
MQIFTLIKMRRGWDMIELLTKRRSIRKYKDKAVEKEKVDMLIKAALLSPSAKNLRDWQFVVVDDRQVLQRLSAVRAASSAFLAAASLGIVVLGEADRNDVWVEDASIAAIIIQLTAENLGLGSCWIQVRNRRHNESASASEYIRGVLSIPDNLEVECIISIGYPDEIKPPHSQSQLDDAKIHWNRYSATR